MNKLTIFIASAAFALPFCASAADGTITFTGEVLDSTCQVVTGTTDFTVTLPTVSTSSLAGAGDVAGRTPFSISLTDCSTQDVAAYFEPGSTVNPSGRLDVVGGASNVQIQLLDASQEWLPILGDLGAVQWVTPTAGEATLDFYAEYYATGESTPGEVNTTVQYTIVYD